VSVADLFIGGVIPGVLMGISLMAVTYVLARRRGYRGSDRRAPFSEVLRTGKHALLALFTPIIIIGGILSGQFTATESAAIAVFYALVISVLVYRQLTPSALWRLTKKSALTTGTVLLVVAAASLFVYVLTLAQVPQVVGQAVGNLADSQWALLLIINVILLIAGTFIDTVSAVVIFTPLFLPLVTTFGIDPVHFGVLLTVNLTIGMCTPPLGVNLFVASSISGVSLLAMLRDLIPFILALLLVLIIVSYVPATVLWLPNLGG
jgi:C4-dicarboxylate transporter DctM subunit